MLNNTLRSPPLKVQKHISIWLVWMQTPLPLGISCAEDRCLLSTFQNVRAESPAAWIVLVRQGGETHYSTLLCILLAYLMAAGAAGMLRIFQCATGRSALGDSLRAFLCKTQGQAAEQNNSQEASHY